MSDFNYFLNRQGPRGMQGEKGEKGNDGNTPTFYAGVDSGTQYTLIIDMGDGNTFETSNLMPTFVNTGGTYLRYDTVNNRYVSAQADKADLSGNVGEVKLATTTSVANETVQDSDAVSYELFRQSGGGGGGTSFIPGTGLELTNADVLNVKIDNNTITTNSSGQLVASGGGTTYTAGDAIDLTGDVISVKTDGTTIGLNASNELELKATIPAAQIQSDWTQADNTKVDFIKNKPTIGAGVITFTQGATVLGTIDVNQTTATTINIPSSGGGGGGSTYAAGNGISISNADVISAKVDGTSIDFDASGNLKFVNGAGYTTNIGTVTSVNNTSPDGSGNVTLSIPDTTYMMTTNTAQDVSGKKTLTSSLVMSGLNGIYYKNSSNNETFLIGKTGNATQGFGKVAVGVINDALELRGSETRPQYWASGGSATDMALLSDVPDTTNMVTTNTTQTISGTKTFSTETHFTGNLTFDSALGTPIIRGMSGSSHRNMITRSNTYSTVTAGNTSDNLILKGALTRPKYSHDSSDGGYLALYSDIPGDMTGAAAGTAGTHGLVPAPTAGDNEKFLRGDGTWQTVSSSTPEPPINGMNLANSNYYTIGNPQITDDGILKDTSDYNYLRIMIGEHYRYDRDRDQKLSIRFKHTGLTWTQNEGLIDREYVDSESLGIRLTLTNEGKLKFRWYDPSAESVVETTLTYAMSNNVWYRAEVRCVSNVLSLYLYDNDNTVLDSSIAFATTSRSIFNGIWLHYIGRNGGGTDSSFQGEIDLTQTIISGSLFSMPIDSADVLPAQGGNSNKFLRTDGTSAYWDNLPSEIPTQSGNSGKFLTTDGSVLSWGTVSSGSSYTSTAPIDITNNDISISYDSSTLDVANGALKVKDSTFITEASLQTVHCVIETYQNGTSWYRLYDDGWVEQGGYIANAGTINLLIEYSDTNYTFVNVGSNYDSTKTTNTVTVTGAMQWVTYGYAAQT